MKVAVYAIAKNEEQFVQRWAESAQGADHIYVLDTGSTDRTPYEVVGMKATLLRRHFTPWRFDVARNYALSNIPFDVDVCIALDMDEVLQPGWRDALEAAYRPDAHRYRYRYVWSWNDNGSEGLVYGGDKVHARHGMVWHHPVHEVLRRIDHPEPEQQVWVPGFEIHHHPDHTKSRAQYLPLLELAVAEEPHDDRNRFYLGREYLFNGRMNEATEQFQQHLKLSNWAPERAASCRYLYQTTGVSKYLWLALEEDPTRRENYVALAQYFHKHHNWAACLAMVQAGLSFTERPLDYLCEGDVWSWLPYDLGAIAAYRLGRMPMAVTMGSIALSHRPDDLRLQENLRWYRGEHVAQENTPGAG